MLENQDTERVKIYTTDKAQSETATDILRGRYGDRIEVHYCVPYLDQGIAVEEFRRLWEA